MDDQELLTWYLHIQVMLETEQEENKEKERMEQERREEKRLQLKTADTSQYIFGKPGKYLKNIHKKYLTMLKPRI